jgi:hypothetical protein
LTDDVVERQMRGNLVSRRLVDVVHFGDRLENAVVLLSNVSGLAPA